MKILNSKCKNLADYRSYNSEVTAGLFSSSHQLVSIETNKDNSSFEQQGIHLKSAYFNEYKDMEKVAKILEM